MKKLLIAGASVATLAAGSLAVATVSPIQLAGARNAPDIEMQAGQAPDTTQPGQPEQSGKRGHRGNRGRGFDEAMDELVKEGTITQEQADKIKAKLKSKMGDRGRDGFRGLIRAGLEETAKSIGITEEQLKAELKAGKSIAEVAQAHGVDPQKVINDLVAAANTKIDEAVASGKLPADRASKLKQSLNEHITKLVNAKRGHKGEGGWDKPDHPGSSSAPDESTTTPPASEPPATEPPTTAAPTTAAPTTAAPTTAAPDPTTSGTQSPWGGGNGTGGTR